MAIQPPNIPATRRITPRVDMPNNPPDRARALNQVGQGKSKIIKFNRPVKQIPVRREKVPASRPHSGPPPRQPGVPATSAPGRSALPEVGRFGLSHFQLAGAFGQRPGTRARRAGFFSGLRPHEEIEFRLPDFQLMLDGFDAGLEILLGQRDFPHDAVGPFPGRNVRIRRRPIAASLRVGGATGLRLPPGWR